MSIDVRYEWDTSAVDQHLDRLAAGPSIESIFGFEATFMGQYAHVKADVHIDTGSLLLSGDADTEYSETRFEGTMTFGGPSGGPVPNVRYAHIEMDRTGLRRARYSGERATSHDFYRSVRHYNPAYTEVILSYYRGV